MDDPRKIKRDLFKKKREIRKKILGSSKAHMRLYDEATKTRRAVKTELFGNKGKGKDTSLELFIEEVLKQNDIKFIPQKAVRWCNYDFYLVEEDILIECQGEYWHCDHRIYPNGPKNEIQKKNLEKNKMKQEIAQSKDIPLIEIWETEIKKFPKETEKALLQLIESRRNELSKKT